MLEPLPETLRALGDYLAVQEPELDGVLHEMAQNVQTLAPDCVGLSVSMIDDDLTFTLVAPDLRVAALDAMQYLEDGPCERAVATGMVVATPSTDPLDEAGWQFYAQAAAAAGVTSSLSLPLRSEGRLIGGINLYAATVDAFDGLHEAISELVGAAAVEAVTNADLSFATRQRATEAPARLRALTDIDTAVGMLAARYDGTIEAARERLAHVAARSGLAEEVVARVIVLLHVQS